MSNEKFNPDKKHEEYEDIVSDTSLIGRFDYEDISSTSGGKRENERRKANTRKKMTTIILSSLISAISIFLVFCLILPTFFPGAFSKLFPYNYNHITSDKEELGFSGVKDKSVINIALFGVDSRDENIFSGNTDSIMILSLNTKSKKVKIFSVMRDTLVPMQYDGKKYCGKINSAYLKGPEHAIKTLNQVYDLDISEYATVNFFGMVDIIDAVGGITATITDDELRWKGKNRPNLNNCMDEICKEKGLDPKEYYIKESGEQTLNGVQAVAYARVRHCTSTWDTRDDFGRTDRQRHVMQSLFNKAISMRKTRYVSLVKALIPCTETSLSYGDIMGLSTSVLFGSPSFEQFRLPPSEYQTQILMKGPSGFGSIIYYDLDYMAKLVNAIIYEDESFESYIAKHPVTKKDWYRK